MFVDCSCLFMYFAFCISNMEQEEFYDFPEDIMARAKKATENLLPKKSRASYDKEFNIFVNWKLKNAVTVVNETVMMAYFQGLVCYYCFTA